VLTAAHCVGNSNYEIQYGGVHISPTGPNVITVAEVRRHSGYNPANQYINDIAVLRVSL
jgi:secreted trypsin-like serine protease